MILIKGEIRTKEVISCEYNYTTRRYDIRFCNGKKYSYAPSNVVHLMDPRVLNPKMYRIGKKGRDFFYNIEAIYVFGRQGEYWHICFGDNIEKSYKRNELEIVESCLDQKQASDVFEYIKQVASLSDIEKDDTGENILVRRFEKMDFIGKNVALANYLNPNLPYAQTSSQEYIPIFPFGCNNSQYMAVKKAMENQISVIQGPPGTGKTQTILNIIANILMQGKTVQIVSNNNSATENVYEKLSSEKYNLGFIAARLGSISNKKKFICAQDTAYPDFSSWILSLYQNVSLEGIRDKSKQLKDVFDKQEELARLKQEQSMLRTELEYFRQYLQETEIDIKSINNIRRVKAKDWLSLWQECQTAYEEKEKVGLILKIKIFFHYGIVDFHFYKQNIVNIITTFQSMYYSAKETELSDRIMELENDLEGVDHDLLDDMCNQSMLILKDKLARKYYGKTSRTIFSDDDLWKTPNDVLKEYPVILSTTFSSRNSLNPKVVYDYLIMDEASQIDIATGALALSCAKNVIIVGDTKQLPNIVAQKKRAEEIFNRFCINEGYRFTKSFLQSILEVMPNVTQTLLREHYRCHPKIINFCNQKFYRGELLIMTKDNGEKDVLAAIKTVPGNHARDHYSQRQIDVIKTEPISSYITDKAETGIIAPYKNQVAAMEKEFNGIEVSTVHKFQGREKDTIIISTVDDIITDFADDPYLINVAVSRAKKRLMLVVTGNTQTRERNITDLIAYIQYNNFEVSESKVYSIFDYLYKQYTKERKAYLQKRRKVSKYDSENLMFALLDDIVSMDQFACLDVAYQCSMRMLIRETGLLNEREQQYATNHLTHIDFLVYNRISLKAVLAIEVDGYKYHKEGTKQAERDLLKNHILELYGIPLLRFKTNGSGEKDRIIRKLEELLA